ncbi:NlpC/P60 family protein [Nocardioides sp.]|uniref:C40 family peptidase n=1 Tax=Nocardioides sp. TaxID=35761 RepID=UPI003527C190
MATVQADLVLANDELRRQSIAAGQAAEAYNGARYHLRQARKQVALAERRAEEAQSDLETQRAAYADALTASYQQSPELNALSAMVDAQGFSEVVDETYTMENAQDAIAAKFDAYRAASTLADVATTQAEQARQQASQAEEAARTARDEARRAEAAAAANAQQVAARKAELVAELARLQGISVALAEQRQKALEEAAAEAAAAAAAQEAADQPDTTGGAAGTDQPAADPQPDPSPSPDPSPDPQPAPTPDPQPAPAPPAPSGGASAAIAFARAQLGEPYRWGAAGPDAWDCSGLTMGAWRAGGKSLPHYSVAQYQQSTPISASSLQPGDLVFWGSSSSPSSIYHVALYVGDGKIIHAPRTGRPVSEESMYYWITPNFYARP